MAQMTPQQKKSQAARRNAAARARLSEEGTEGAEDAERATEGEVYRMAPEDRRQGRRAEAGQYNGPRARPRAVAFGTEQIVVPFEGRDWLIDPSPLDNWDDLEDFADEDAEMDEKRGAREAVSSVRALFGGDPDRWAEFKDHLRDRYGYVSRNLVFEFLAIAREEAESLGN